MSKKYIIGVDLGTTNCTASYIQDSGSEKFFEEKDQEIVQFAIPQITEPGEQRGELSLPSFLYFPLEEELSKKNMSISWDCERSFCVGLCARSRGAEIPERLVASIKSWLCHDGIDRRKKQFPEGAEVDKLSPVEITSEYLKHIREAWEESHSDAPFSEQTVLITVPASFNPDARQLVQEAAEMASYPKVILLEEPQAAFYAWLNKYRDNWRKTLSLGDRILVIDIGGGTTDFSLIGVGEKEGSLVLERLSVGSHLLLGGDNMDLSLAYVVKGKLEEEGHEVDEWQLRQLVYACREAKESLLSDESLEVAKVTIQGRGSSLMGSILTSELSQGEVEKFIVDAFFPLLLFDEKPKVERRSGIRQMGLSYAQDPRVSCHLAQFLSAVGNTQGAEKEGAVMPTAVLFNGGVMKAKALQERLLKLLNNWGKELQCDEIKVLEGADYDFSVGKGAAYYGLARLGKGVRIKSGTSHSYYIGVEDSIPAVPGFELPMKAYCVVPFGMEEGSEVELEGKEFTLILGESVTFRFFSRKVSCKWEKEESELGLVVKNWKSELQELHPIETVLEQGNADGKTVRVKLKAKVTELGVLELWCVADEGREWKLEFDLRQEEPAFI